MSCYYGFHMFVMCRLNNMDIMLSGIILFAVTLTRCHAQGNGVFERGNLAKSLLDNYSRIGGKYGRPAYNATEAVNVQVGMSAVRIQEFNEVPMMLNLRAWLKYSWRDQLLRWDPSEHGGVEQIRVDPKSIWMPDISLRNGYDVQMEVADNVLAVVNFTGHVVYKPPANLRVICGGSDSFAECSFVFTSLTYDESYLDLNFYEGLANINDMDFVGDHAYRTMFVDAVKKDRFYPHLVEAIPELHFKMILERPVLASRASSFTGYWGCYLISVMAIFWL